MLLEGIRLLPHDPRLGELTLRTLQLAFEATALALVLGLPAACVIGIGRSRLSGAGQVVANAGLGLPPVAVGVYFFLLLEAHYAPWGGRWLESMNAMVLGQAVLALPIIVAIGAIAIRDLPNGLVDQARAFGARGWRLAWFTVREAKIGVLTAVVLAIGSAFAEVGAVTLLGGNDPDSTATLASQVINDTQGQTDIPAAVEHTIVLLGLMLALGLVFTALQHSGRRA